jgi:excisionase family DNA binding protein
MGQFATQAAEGVETLLTPREVCAALRISYATFLRLIDRGELQVVRVGASLRVRPAELERLLAGREARA